MRTLNLFSSWPTFAIFAISLLPVASKAQTWTGSSTPQGRATREGDMTVVDLGGLHRTTIGAAWGPGCIWGNGYLGFNLRRENTGQWSYNGDGAANFGAVVYNTGSDVMFSCKPSTGPGGGNITDADVTNNVVMRVTPGKVVIGNSAGCNPTISFPGGYGLYVHNGILTEKLKIALRNTSSWSDYVFQPDYQLRSLPEVQTYIAEHGHLPDVPSADDVVRDGIDAAQMDATLLRKIEELTLYVLKQDEKIAGLEKKLSQTKRRSH